VFASLHLPPGFSAALEEQGEITGQERRQIAFAVIAALVLIYMILAALHESFLRPLLIMIAIPLALVGVFIAFIVADAPFDPTAYIGVILLAGIVVNNAILLVDHIHRLRGQGASLLDAVVRGTRDRIRPIFMTTGTTVLGVLPLLLIGAGMNKRQIWSSLALCTVGGLTSSTAFILIVIPVLYFHGEKLRARAGGRAGKPAASQRL